MTQIIIALVFMVWFHRDKFPVIIPKHFPHQKILLKKVKLIQIIAKLAVGFSEPHLAADAAGVPAPSLLSSDSCAVDSVQGQKKSSCDTVTSFSEQVAI